MSYIRLYASKTNTIFKRNSGSAQQKDGTVNTGQQTISELYTGSAESKLLLSFDLTSIKPLLEAYSYTCNLRVWDAGVIYEPTIQLNNVNLYYFQEDFVEGDGFAFFDGKAITGLSNNVNRDSLNTWAGVFTTGLLPAFSLSTASQDLVFTTLETFVATSVTANELCNFAIEVENLEPLAANTYTKFVHTRHTRTIYQPYLEFEIDDTIVDNRASVSATKTNRLYLISDSGEAFVGTLTCNITDEFGTVVSNPAVVNPSTGVYYVEFTPIMSQANQTFSDNWLIDGLPFVRNAFRVISPNVVVSPTSDGPNGLVFYPSTSYAKPLVRLGDKILFNVVSLIRSKGNVVTPDYQYRIVTTSNFELTPWQDVNCYNNKMFFSVDTSYFYPELEYEVMLRLNDGKQIRTSSNTYKFKLIEDGPTHLANRNSTPYQSRDYIFKK